MTHYDIPKELEAEVAARKLEGPCFIGQGWSHQVGSDCYGGYVTFIGTNADGKPYYGLVGADSHFEKCWEDGHQTCVMPKDKTPEEYVVQFRGRWWKCNDKGDRYLGSHMKVSYSWNGAFAYQDPSF